MIIIKLDELLKQKNKSYYWLAKQCNMSQHNLTNIVNGKTVSIKFETIEKLCKALECTPNDIFSICD